MTIVSGVVLGPLDADPRVKGELLPGDRVPFSERSLGIPQEQAKRDQERLHFSDSEKSGLDPRGHTQSVFPEYCILCRHVSFSQMTGLGNGIVL